MVAALSQQRSNVKKIKDEKVNNGQTDDIWTVNNEPDLSTNG